MLMVVVVVSLEQTDYYSSDGFIFIVIGHQYYSGTLLSIAITIAIAVTVIVVVIAEYFGSKIRNSFIACSWEVSVIVDQSRKCHQKELSLAIAITATIVFVIIQVGLRNQGQ